MSGVSLKNRAADTGRVLADRVAWRVRGQPIRVFAAPATMARTFTYLFGIGATLLLVTLPLPHSADRNTAALIAIALVAYLAAGGFLILFDRLPLWSFEASPLVGTVLVSLAAYFGGSEAPAAYATYYFWVAASACYFLRPAVAATHLVLASAGYGIVLIALGDATVPVLKWAVATGTLLVVGTLITALQSQMERTLTQLGAAARTDSLTGLANRRELEQRFAGELERSTRGGRPLCDSGARPGLVQGVQRPVRSCCGGPRPGPACGCAEAGDQNQRRRCTAGRRGVRRAGPRDRRARGLSAGRAAPGRVQGGLRPPAGEDDRELRGGQLPRARDHRGRAPALGRSSPVRGEGGRT